MWLAVDDLARNLRPDPTAARAVEGRVRDRLIRDWQEVAGPALSSKVLVQLEEEEFPLSSDPGWMPLPSYLRLHELIAVLDHGSDGVAFAARWHRDVLRRIPKVARWSMRAFGVRRGLELAPRFWPEVWSAPAPELIWPETDREPACEVRNFTHLPSDHPTFRLMTALHFRLALQLLAGPEARVEAAVEPDLRLRLRW